MDRQPFLTFNLSIWKIITILIGKIPYELKYSFIQEKKCYHIYFPFCMKGFFQALINFLPFGVMMTTKQN
jgi:hypothetical protein